MTRRAQRDRKNVAIVVHIDSGSFETGFRVRFEVLSSGRIIAEQRGLGLPPAPNLPQLYHQWRETYYQLGLDPNNQMNMAPIQAVQGQTTHHSTSCLCQQATQALEHALTAWYDQEKFKTLGALIRAETIVHSDRSVPIIFDFDTGNGETNAQLRKLPWHLWRLVRRTLPNTEVVLSSGYQQQVEPLKLPVKVLLVLGSSEGGLDLKQDEQAWAELKTQGAALTKLPQPTAGELNRVLRSQPWDILFFAGHSITKQDTLDDGYIQISDTEIIKLDVLDTALMKARQNGLKLAIFNSCDGLGLAKKLSELGIPFSMVMREPVPDVIARDFLKFFLAEFASGKPLYLAMREARSQLRYRQGDPQQTYPCATWLPILCQNPTQPELFWPTQKSLKRPLLLGVAAAAVAAAIGLSTVVSGNRSSLSPTSVPIQTSNLDSDLPAQSIAPEVTDDEFSIGEQFLLRGPHSGAPQAGVDAFRAGNYGKAIDHFRQSLSLDRNNPELIIYLNNAIAQLSGKPIRTIAVSIPARDAEDQAKELLRGVGQFQAENNCGLNTLIQAIEMPESDLNCRTGDIALQILLVDHENRNDDNKILGRFQSIVRAPNVLGLIGRYNSSMTFAVEKSINDGNQLPVISTTSTAVRQGERASGYVFRTSPTDEITAQKWRDYLDQKGAKKIVTLSDSSENSQYSQSLHQEFLNLLPPTIRNQLYECDLDNIDQCLAQLQGSTADALVLMPSDDEDYIRAALNFVRRYDNEFKVTPIVIGGDTLYDGDLVLQGIAQGSLLENLIVAVPWHRGATPDAFEQGAADLWVDSINWRTVMGYDATKLFASAIATSPDCKNGVMAACRVAVQDKLLDKGIDDGVTGKVRFSEKGNRKAVDGSRVSVLVKVDLDQRTFECLEGEPCAE